MNRAALLTAASVLALCAGTASATTVNSTSSSNRADNFSRPRGAKVLWNQNSNDAGQYIVSNNLTSGSSSVYDNQGADDFVIPKGRVWTIREVDVTGTYFTGPGPATSENVIFYKDKAGIPGASVKNGTFNFLDGTGGPNFSIALRGSGLKLKAGHYWVSVVANIDFPTSGQWGPEVSSVQHYHQAMWQNPNGGYGICLTWGAIENCLGVTSPDLMFDLKGTSKGK